MVIRITSVDGVYKRANLGAAAGRKDDGTYKIKPIPDIHIDAGDAYFLAKGSRPFGRRKGGPLLDELTIANEKLRKEQKELEERTKREKEEARIQMEKEAKEFAKELEAEALAELHSPSKKGRKNKIKAKANNEMIHDNDKNPVSENSEVEEGKNIDRPESGDNREVVRELPLSVLAPRKELPSSPFRADLSGWFKKLEGLQQDLTQVETVQVKPLKEKLEKIVDELKHSKELAHQYKSRSHKLEGDIKRIQKEYENVKEKFKKFKEDSHYEITGLKFKVDDLQAIVDTGTKELEVKLENVTKKYNDTFGMLRLEQKKARDNLTKLKKAEASSRSLRDKANKSEEATKKVTQQARVMKMKLAAMKSKVQELENVKDLVSKQAENEEKLENERKKLLTKISDLENDIIKRGKKAVEEREKLEFQVAELKVQCAKGVSTESRGKKRFEKKIRQLESMVKQIENSKAKMEISYKDKINKTTSESKTAIVNLKSKLSVTEDNFRQIQSQLKDTERKRQEETEHLSQELGTLDATYAHLVVKHKKIVKNYTGEIESLEHKLVAAKRLKEEETIHLNKKIESLEKKIKESKSINIASTEKQSNEIERLRSWNKELEKRMVIVKQQYDSKEENVKNEFLEQIELLQQNVNTQTAEIDLLTKRNQLLQEGNESLRKAREDEKKKMLKEMEQLENDAHQKMENLSKENDNLREHISVLNLGIIQSDKSYQDEKQLLHRQIEILQTEKKDAYAFKYMDDEDSKLMKAVVQLAEAQSKAKAAIVEADVIKQKLRYIQEDFEKERADFKLRERMSMKKNIDMGEQLSAAKEESFNLLDKLKKKDELLLQTKKSLDKETHRGNCLQSKYDTTVERFKEALKEDERKIILLSEQLAIFSNDSFRLIL
eukprot:g97.t1